MPTLKYDDVDKDLGSGVRPIYLVHGDEPYLVEDACGRILRAALGDAMEQFNEEVFRARESGARDVVASCSMLPVMADRRVVMVKEVNVWKAAEHETLLPYLEDPSPTTCLILASQEKLDARGRLVTAVKKKGAVVEVRHPYGRELMQKLQGMVKAAGKRLEPDAASLLLDLAGTDLQALKMQVEKLALYVGDKKTITQDDVSEAVADIKLFTIFEFTDALGNRNLEAALRSFRRMLDLGEAPVKILGMVARHFRILFQLKENQKKGVPLEESAKTFKLPAGILRNNYLPQSRKFANAELTRMWKMLADLDYSLKSSGTSRELTFERMIVKLCGT